MTTTSATTTSATTSTALDVREMTLPPALVLELEVSAGPGPGAITAAMGKAFSTLMNVIQGHNLVAAGSPRAIYQSWDGSGTRFTAAIPILNAPTEVLEQEGVKVASIPEQQALRIIHRGSYQTLRDTYTQIEAWLRGKGAIRTQADWARYCPMWEEYVGDPATTPEPELVTRIFLPLR